MLWAVDLLAVVYLCYWALKHDSRREQTDKRG